MTRFWKLDLQAWSGSQSGTKLTRRAPTDEGRTVYSGSFPVSLIGIELSDPSLQIRWLPMIGTALRQER
jgi:hypothetical protein